MTTDRPDFPDYCSQWLSMAEHVHEKNCQSVKSVKSVVNLHGEIQWHLADKKC